MSRRPYDFDPAKAAANLREHGLSFDDGFLVMAQDPARLLTVLDLSHDYGEDRWIAIGPHPAVPSLILHVAYTWRDDRPRMISVRKATKRERRAHAHRSR